MPRSTFAVCAAFFLSAVLPAQAGVLKIRRPASGTITGTLNRSAAQLTLDRRSWSITGTANNSRVELLVDHANKTVTGEANNRPVRLEFDWSTGKIAYRDAQSLQPILEIDWESRTATVWAGRPALKLSFDLQAGTLKDADTGGRAVDLSLDGPSGLLKGHMNNAPVELTLTNLDLSDFLTHLYIFFPASS